MEFARAAQIGDHALGQLAPVEGSRSIPGDPTERAGEGRQPQSLAGNGCPIVRQINDPPTAALEQLVAIARPVKGNARRHHEALLRAADRRLQQLAELPGAVALQQPGPGVDRARNGHGVHAALELVDAEPHEALDRGGGRRPSRAVERDHCALGGCQQDEAVAPDPGHRRLDHALNGDRRDRRVDGIAAGTQDIERREGRQRVRSRRHTVLAVGRRAAGQLEVTHGRSPGQVHWRILVLWLEVSCKTGVLFTFHNGTCGYNRLLPILMKRPSLRE